MCVCVCVIYIYIHIDRYTYTHTHCNTHTYIYRHARCSYNCAHGPRRSSASCCDDIGCDDITDCQTDRQSVCLSDRRSSASCCDDIGVGSLVIACEVR